MKSAGFCSSPASERRRGRSITSRMGCARTAPPRQGADDARRRHDHAPTRRQDRGEGGQARGRPRTRPARRKEGCEGAAVAARAVKPMTLAEALDAYAKDMAKRREPSETTRRQAIYYARKAIALMEAGGLAVDRVDDGPVRKLARARTRAARRSGTFTAAWRASAAGWSRRV